MHMLEIRIPQHQWHNSIGVTLLAYVVFPIVAVADDSVQMLQPDGVYETGSLVTGPCESNGPIPEDIACGDSGRQFMIATKLIAGGWDASISPPACIPIELPPLTGSYRVTIFETGNEWVADKCYDNIGRIYLTEDKSSEMRSFQIEVVKPQADCPAANDDWSDDIEYASEQYRELLDENLSRRPAIQDLRANADSRSGITGRAASSQADNIEDGLDELQEDCERIADEITDAVRCEEFSDCGDDIARAIHAGPGEFCRAVHEVVIASIPGGANSATQAYDWFRENVPCLSKLYDQGDFADLVDAVRKSRQPHAGLP